MGNITQKEVDLALELYNDEEFVVDFAKIIGVPSRFLSPIKQDFKKDNQ